MHIVDRVELPHAGRLLWPKKPYIQTMDWDAFIPFQEEKE
jgi:hypothetical protein